MQSIQNKFQKPHLMASVVKKVSGRFPSFMNFIFGSLVHHLNQQLMKHHSQIPICFLPRDGRQVDSSTHTLFLWACFLVTNRDLRRVVGWKANRGQNPRSLEKNGMLWYGWGLEDFMEGINKCKWLTGRGINSDALRKYEAQLQSILKKSNSQDTVI